MAAPPLYNNQSYVQYSNEAFNPYPPPQQAYPQQPYGYVYEQPTPQGYGYPSQQPQVVMANDQPRQSDNDNCCMACLAALACCFGCCLAEECC